MMRFILCCFVSLQLNLYAVVDTVWLTWQRDPCTTMTVQWFSEGKEAESQVLFRRSGDTDWCKAFGTHAPLPGGGENVLVHSVEMTGLIPDTRYTFRINEEAEQRHFHTIPATLSRPVRFVAGGDVYHTTIDRVENAHKQAAAANPDFALVGGDIAYSVSTKAAEVTTEKVERWKEFLKAWTDHMVTPAGDLIPILPTVGNHDVVGGYRQPGSRAACYYCLFPMPGEQGFQVLDFGDYLSLFLLDSGHTHEIAGSQTTWLDKALSQREHVAHKVAMYHVGAWPSVRESHGDIALQVRKHWVPLFEKHYLHVAFEHHDHAYKRTHLIRNDRISNRGVLYLGDGAWGVKPRKPKPASERWYLAKTEQKQHVIVTELTPYTRSYNATDVEGQVFDSYLQYVAFSAGPEPRDGPRLPAVALDPRLFLRPSIGIRW